MQLCTDHIICQLYGSSFTKVSKPAGILLMTVFNLCIIIYCYTVTPLHKHPCTECRHTPAVYTKVYSCDFPAIRLCPFEA